MTHDFVRGVKTVLNALSYSFTLTGAQYNSLRSLILRNLHLGEKAVDYVNVT